ncbi:MAG: hypothetical protein ACYCPP_01330 [Nitrososphaerales archaeon]
MSVPDDNAKADDAELTQAYYEEKAREMKKLLEKKPLCEMSNLELDEQAAYLPKSLHDNLLLLDCLRRRVKDEHLDAIIEKRIIDLIAIFKESNESIRAELDAVERELARRSGRVK